MSKRIVDDPSQHGWVEKDGEWVWKGSGGGVVGPISLNDLEDVLAESPEKDNLIIFDGSEWVSSFPPLIESEITYQGGYNFSLDAPADPQDGDLYINDTDGTVHASWGAIAGTPVLAGNVVAYAEAKGRWFLLGDLSSTAVTSISQGAGVSVDSSKPREPVVGVNFGTAAGQVAQGNHNHSGVYEPVINPKNSAFNKNFGTAAGQVAEGNHNHDGVYQPTGNYLTSYTETDPTVGPHIKAITAEQIAKWDTPSAGGGMEYEIDQTFTIALPKVTWGDGKEAQNALVIKYPVVDGVSAIPPVVIESPSNPSIKFVSLDSSGNVRTNAIFGYSANGDTGESGFQIGKDTGSSANNGGSVDLGLNHMYSQYNWLRNCRITGTYTGTVTFTSRSFQNGAPVIDARELISVLSDLRDVTKDVAVTSVDSLKTAMSSKLDSLVDRLTRGIEESRAVDEDAWAYTTMSENDYNEFMREKYGEPEE